MSVADGGAGAGPLDARLRAFCDLSVADVREGAGRHEYDGVVQDLSPDGVRTGLAAFARARASGTSADRPWDRDQAFDEALLAKAGEGLHVVFGELADHRRNPVHHLANLDVACYDRPYAPAEERDAARRAHLAAYPDAVDGAVAALDRVPAPTARALLGSVRGLAVGLEPGPATRAVDRLAAHLAGFAEHGDPDPAYGAAALTRLLEAADGAPVDLDRLAVRAAAERDRLRAMLEHACARLEPGTPPGVLVARLLRDHPSGPDQIYAEARTLIDEATAFTVERDLITPPGGQCLVGPAPPSRRWAMAMMSWSAAYEPEGPSWYHVTPPDPDWPAQAREEWLAVFSRTTLPAITVHEVTPGHFAHGRALRRLDSDTRRLVSSAGFIEGWAHYAEEMVAEEGFRADDPRYVIGVAVEALVRVTRLRVALGMHAFGMTVDEAAERFVADAFLRGPAARSEAERATFDPTYGRYTTGKWAILATRESARRAWGVDFTPRRFHDALLALGAPPPGLLGHVLTTGGIAPPPMRSR